MELGGIVIVVLAVIGNRVRFTGSFLLFFGLPFFVSRKMVQCDYFGWIMRLSEAGFNIPMNCIAWMKFDIFMTVVQRAT
jgi:hypothetical protein